MLESTNPGWIRWSVGSFLWEVVVIKFWGVPCGVAPIAGWIIWENPIKMDGEREYPCSSSIFSLAFSMNKNHPASLGYPQDYGHHISSSLISPVDIWLCQQLPKPCMTMISLRLCLILVKLWFKLWIWFDYLPALPDSSDFNLKSHKSHKHLCKFTLKNLTSPEKGPKLPVLSQL